MYCSIYCSIFFIAVVWNKLTMSLMYACKKEPFFFFFPQRTVITSGGEVKKSHLWFEITHSLFGEKTSERNGEKWRQSRKPCPFAWNSSFPEPHWKRFSLYIIFIVLFAFNLSFSISWNYLFSTLCLSISSYGILTFLKLL